MGTVSTSPDAKQSALGLHAFVPRRALVFFAAALFACDSDMLSQRMQAPDPPDAGPPPVVADASEPPDAGQAVPVDPVDAGTVEPAREPVYIHTGDTLYSWDPGSNVASAIGQFRAGGQEITGMVDIAIDLAGNMFGGTTEKEIYRINPSTAACTFLSSYDDILHGLTFVSDGRLVVAGLRVDVVDPNTGRVANELVGPDRWQTSGDIVGLPDGKLYWSVRGDRNEGDALVRIDPISGDTRYLGAGTVSGLYGLGYAYGELYGFSRDGVVVTLDRNTGAVLESRPLDGRWYGATTNPVLW